MALYSRNGGFVRFCLFEELIVFSHQSLDQLCLTKMPVFCEEWYSALQAGCQGKNPPILLFTEAGYRLKELCTIMFREGNRILMTCKPSFLREFILLLFAGRNWLIIAKQHVIMKAGLDCITILRPSFCSNNS